MNRSLEAALCGALVACLATPPVALATAPFTIAVDPAQRDKIAKQVEAAQAKGDSAATLRELSRLLELYPNDPLVQGVLYAGMSGAAELGGDKAGAGEYLSIATRLDPDLQARLAPAMPAGATRGKVQLDDIAKVLGIVVTTAQAIDTYKQAKRERKMADLQAQLALAQAQLQLQQSQQQGQPPAGQLPYPQAAAGAPGYAAPQAGYQPMPGYAAAPGMPPGQGGQPAAPQQGRPPAGQPPAGAAPTAVGYAPPPDTAYAATAGWPAPPPTTRGEAEAKPVRVIHDHYELGDKAYFAAACGALLSIAGDKLVFTPTGGEAPRVIPASDIRELRLNREIAKDKGAFHIATRSGLYLQLAPEDGTPASGRSMVEKLRKELSLGK